MEEIKDIGVCDICGAEFERMTSEEANKRGIQAFGIEGWYIFCEEWKEACKIVKEGEK